MKIRAQIGSIYAKKQKPTQLIGRDCRLISFADFLGGDPYPKPFKQTLRVRLAFLTLIRSIKQACFAASH